MELKVEKEYAELLVNMIAGVVGRIMDSFDKYQADRTAIEMRKLDLSSKVIDVKIRKEEMAIERMSIENDRLRQGRRPTKKSN